MLSLVLFLACSPATGSVAGHDVTPFKTDHLGDPKRLLAAQDGAGRVTAVVGKFDIGLDAATSKDPGSVANAVAGFFSNHASAFGTDAPYDLDLTHTESVQVEDNMRAMRFEQRFSSTAIEEGEITVTLDNNGMLLSVNGALARKSQYSSLPLDIPTTDDLAVLFNNVATVLSLDETLSGDFEDPTQWQRDDSSDAYFSKSSNVLLERVLALDTPEVHWRVNSPEISATFFVDGTPKSIASKKRQTDTIGNCNVLHSDYEHFSGSALTFDVTGGECCDSTVCTLCGGLADCSDLECAASDIAHSGKACCNEGGKSGTTFDSTRACQASAGPGGTCNWHLQRDQGISSGIARVDDADSFSEMEINASCTATPTFSSTQTDNFHQENAFYAIQRARSVMNLYVFSQVTPDRDENTDVHIDDDFHCNPFPAPRDPQEACFDPLFTSIHFGHLVSRDMDSAWHEYGHFAQWRYGDQSQNCGSSDQGATVAETLANCFGYISALDEMPLTYCATGGATRSTPCFADPSDPACVLDGFSGGQGPDSHTNAASIMIADHGSSPCDKFHGDPHLVGMAFEQAVWELLFNSDCTVQTCSCSTTFGSYIWPGESATQVKTHVGKALAHAEKVLGSSQNLFQVALYVEDQIGTDSGSVSEARASEVFSHHQY